MIAFSCQPQKGFTLVELAIAMVIIGLIAGGILKGKEMIVLARMNSAVAQLNENQSATITFFDVYGSYPGDMVNAQSRLNGCTAANFCTGGDGDTLVGVPITSGEYDVSTGAENIQYWKHLAMADMIKGVYIGANPATPAWGETFPAARIKGGFQVARIHQPTPFYTLDGHYFRLQGTIQANPGGSLNLDQGSLSPRYAKAVDTKLDDGAPGTGIVQAYDIFYGAQNGPCEATATRNYYDLTEEDVICVMLFKFK